MAGCTFLGHMEFPYSMAPKLTDTVENLIKNYDVDTFYLTDQGQYHKIAKDVLTELQKKYPDIKLKTISIQSVEEEPHEEEFYVFLRSVMRRRDERWNTPPRSPIVWRNIWLLSGSDYVITYIEPSWEDFDLFLMYAKLQNKTILNIAE